jgi:tRNA 2-thiouridine synthesizing protein C
MARKFLFISTGSPWHGSNAAACLDALMTHAIFDQETWLYLTGDGVFQLVDNQEGTATDCKTLAKIFPALELYGIRGVIADTHSLAIRGLAQHDLVMEVTPGHTGKLQELIRECDRVLVF